MTFPRVLISISSDGLNAKGASRSDVQILLLMDDVQAEVIQRYNRNQPLYNYDDSKIIYHTHTHTMLYGPFMSYRVESVTTTDAMASDLTVGRMTDAINYIAKVLDRTRYFPLQFEEATDKINAAVDLFSEMARRKSNIKMVQNLEVIFEIIPAEKAGCYTVKFINASSTEQDVTPVILAKQLSSTQIFKQTVAHPVSGIVTDLASVIMDLNDDHNWTFEQIADWLESLDININIARREELQ